jgi:hypothetical protein
MTFNFFTSPKIREAWSYRDEPENMAILAVVFWRGLLVFALVVIVSALWFGFQELDATSQAETPPTTSSTAPPPLDHAQLESTLDAFSTRQTQYQTLSQSPAPDVTDPSK